MDLREFEVFQDSHGGYTEKLCLEKKKRNKKKKIDTLRHRIPSIKERDTQFCSHIFR